MTHAMTYAARFEQNALDPRRRGLSCRSGLGRRSAGPRRPARMCSAPDQVPVTITWAMAERFGPGYDRNRNGRPDMPNSSEYVNPGRYEVRLAACVDSEVSRRRRTCPAPGRSTAAIKRSSLRATGPEPVVRLPQGSIP